MNKILRLIFLLGAFALGFYFCLLINKSKLETKTEPNKIVNLNPYKIFNLVNDYRVNNGLEPLEFNPKLCTYTERRLNEIHNDWSHKGFRASPPEYAIPGSDVGENLGEGYNDETILVNSWIASPGHLKNIVKKEFTDTCIKSDYQYKSEGLTSFTVQEFSSDF